MLEDCLRVGGIYETVIGGAKVGQTLYIGKISKKGVKYRHMVVFRGKQNLLGIKQIECWRFNNYAVEDRKLKAFIAVESRLSMKEESFIAERLKKAGL